MILPPRALRRLRSPGCLRFAALLAVAWVCGSEQLHAAALTSESTVGVAADYNSNPSLATSGGHAAESAALQATLPATYTGDAMSFDLIPSFRLAETHGDTQLLSDYQRLDADWHLGGERSSLVLNLSEHRDSTFYNTFENAELRGTTLPRLDSNAQLGWSRSLTELSSLQLAGSYEQVIYGSQSGLKFQNFDYIQGSLQYSRTLNERWSSATGVGYGHYSLWQTPSSNESRFARTSLTWAASESWSGSAEIGYSRISSSAEALLCCAVIPVSGGFLLEYVPVRESSSTGVLNYNVSVAHRSEHWGLDIGASRSVQPSSLGGLLTDDNASIQLSVPWTERLGFAAAIRYARQSDAFQANTAVSAIRYYQLDGNLNWQWTEHWTLELQGTYTLDHVLRQSSTTAISLMLSRQFGLIRL